MTPCVARGPLIFKRRDRVTGPESKPTPPGCHGTVLVVLAVGLVVRRVTSEIP